MSVTRSDEPGTGGLPRGASTLGALDRQRKPRAHGASTVFLALSLAVVQLVTGVFTISQALITDGLHSLAECAIALSAHNGSSPAQRPGFGAEVELLPANNGAALLASALTLGVALGMVVHCVLLLQTGYGLFTVKPIALYLSMLFFLAKNWLARREQNQTNGGREPAFRRLSKARFSYLSSVVVLIGIFGSMAGLNVLDPLASIVISWMLIGLGWKAGRAALRI